MSNNKQILNDLLKGSKAARRNAAKAISIPGEDKAKRFIDDLIASLTDLELEIWRALNSLLIVRRIDSQDFEKPELAGFRNVANMARYNVSWFYFPDDIDLILERFQKANNEVLTVAEFIKDPANWQGIIKKTNQQHYNDSRQKS